MHSKTVILIGPMASRKSAVARQLSKITGQQNVPMDRVRGYYYIKDGIDTYLEASLSDFSELVAYWKPFELKAVTRKSLR